MRENVWLDLGFSAEEAAELVKYADEFAAIQDREMKFSDYVKIRRGGVYVKQDSESQHPGR